MKRELKFNSLFILSIFMEFFDIYKYSLQIKSQG